MCGLVDFEALQTCITRLAALLVAGISGYAVCKAISFYRERNLKRERQEEEVLSPLPCGLAVRDSGERSNS
jgi:hypothetical protein